MKIVVDARKIAAKPSETGRYMEELVTRFPVIEPSWIWHFIFSDEKARNRVLSNAAIKGQYGISSEVIPAETNFFKRLFVSPFRFLKKIRKLGGDLYFTPDTPVSRFGFQKGKYSEGNFVCVTSLQNTVRQQKTLSRTGLKRQSLQLSLKQAVRQSAAIIAPSATARNDIADVLGLSSAEKEKIHTIYNGVAEIFKDGRNEFAKHAAFCRTILSVTNFDFDKDTNVLLIAFSKLIRDKTFADVRLVCIGPENGNDMRARDMSANLGCADKVTVLSNVSREDIAKVAREATLFVNPSAYEDFGQTIVEAMACGLPTVCCSNGAQGEIVQDAAVKIPADDVQSLWEALKYVLADAKTRKNLAERGLKRTAEFSWDNTAAEHIALFRKILSANGDGK